MSKRSKRKPKVKKVNLENKYSVDEVFKMIGVDNLMLTGEEQMHNDDQLFLEGKKVYKRSLRYATFYQKGCECVECGKRGTYFQLTSTSESPGRAHFNLYADDGTLMTKDHIWPKSKGGEDKIENMQTMCVHCNQKKGNRTPDEE